MAGKKKAKMGRPPLPAGSAKEIVFTLRLNESERDAIAAAAGQAGVAPTRWARDVLVERANAWKLR